ncbi:hypothetical protein SAMN02982931_04198 [Bauldia litoralis]|uniref:Glycosyl transferases group 1 n=1 Tax=Bauldia litoralis TaxID=665467 RepID=A0A1G6E6S3_9HYPH|nr:hypothetical protein SAMN02982931_04198 [Bauldia litoralis]
MTSIMRRDRPILLWAGRVSFLFGYGAATRRYLEAFRSIDFDVVVFDIVSGMVVGPDSRAAFSVSVRDGITSLTFESGRDVVLVVSDTPLGLPSFQVKGSIRLISSTMFECDGLPTGWLRRLLRCEEVWVPSEFNRETFRNAGIPAARLQVMPIPANPALAENAIAPMNLSQANRFRFLTVASAWDRKDIGMVLRAYLSEFTAADDATMVVKLPGHFDGFGGAREIVRKVVFPDFDIDDPDLAHVLVLCGDFDDERLWSLFAACDAYVSSDRGKGWDLPAFEAMQLGLVSIGVDWGGNTAFMTKENSVLIPPEPAHVLTGEDLIKNKRVYRGQSWASIDAAKLSRAMRDVFEKPEDYRAIRANAPEVNQTFAGARVAEQMVARIDQLQSSDFRGDGPAIIRFKTSAFPPASPQATVSADDLAAADPELKPFDAHVGNAEDWLQTRRDAWNRMRVTPRGADLARLREMRNTYYGRRIFIFGNKFRPKQFDFSLLEGECSFGTNRTYKIGERKNWVPTFYTVLDWHLASQIAETVNGLTGSLYFFPQRFFGLLRDGNDVRWYEAYPPGESLLDQFETYLPKGARGTSVATVAIQIAYYLGFREFYLVGHELTRPRRSEAEEPGADAAPPFPRPVLIAKRRELIACRDAIEYHGGTIHDATPGGGVDDLPHVSFKSLFGDGGSGAG